MGAQETPDTLPKASEPVEDAGHVLNRRVIGMTVFQRPSAEFTDRRE